MTSDAPPDAPPPGAPSATNPLPHLRLVGPGDEFREWSFDTTFEVGRLLTAGLCLDATTHPVLSRRHAIVFPAEAGWWIADQGSTHGTWLNAVQIGADSTGPLKTGDIVRFAEYAFRVEFASEPLPRPAADEVTGPAARPRQLERSDRGPAVVGGPAMKQFIALCLKQPLEATNLLVLADWLEDREHPSVPLLRHVAVGWGEEWQTWADRGRELTRNYLARRVGIIDLEADGQVRLGGTVPYRLRLFSLQTQTTPDWWANVPPHWWADHHAEGALFLLLLALLTQRPGTPVENGQAEPFVSRLFRLALEGYEGLVSELLPEAGVTDAEREAGLEAVEGLSKLMAELLREANTGEVPGSGAAARRVLSAYQNGFQTLGYLSGGGVWRELLRQAGQDISEVIARIPLTSNTVAIGFDEVSPRPRRTYLGTAHAGRDVALFDRLLREAFEGDGGVVCWNCDDEWVVFTGADGAESRVRAVAASYAEMTPFTFDGAYTVRSATGEERAARVTGAGLYERAFRCVMDRLVPGEELGRHRWQVQNLYMDDNSAAALNAPVWKDDLSRVTTFNRDVHRIEWLSTSLLSCPFCHSPVRDEGQPICVDTVCPVCRAHFGADFRLE